MRLIDADALIGKRAHAKQYEDEMYVIGQGYVMDAPTIDAVPVVRGEWITTETYSSMYRTNLSETTCSACGKRPNIYMLKSDYCPNCGAKMEDKPCQETT